MEIHLRSVYYKISERDDFLSIQTKIGLIRCPAILIPNLANPAYKVA